MTQVSATEINKEAREDRHAPAVSLAPCYEVVCIEGRTMRTDSSSIRAVHPL
jgi:hypothetical protein